MRWRVHGTDAASGKTVELGLDEPDPSLAIRAAIDRQIMVSHVTPGEIPGRGRRWTIPVMAALLVVALGGVISLYAQNRVLRGNLNQALQEQTRMAASVAQAEHVAADIRASGGLAKDAASQVNHLAEDLANARSRMSLTERQLSAAQREKNDLEQSAQRLPALEKDVISLHEQLNLAQGKLATADKLAAQLKAEVALQARRMDQLESTPAAGNSQAPRPLAATPDSTAKIAALEQANRNLAAEIEKLKAELLLAAAQSTIIAPREVPATSIDIATAPPTWALRVSYETASAFLALHTDHDTQSTAPDTGGMLASFGMQTSNAVQVRFVHDRAKERVYSITLVVSLAADGPKEKLAENRELIGQFLQTFASGVKDPSVVISAAVGQLAGLDETRRLLFIQDDSKLTIWNDKTGVLTFRVEPMR